VHVFGRDLSRRELMRRVGNLAQVGGIEVVAYEEGHARGTRAVQCSSGAGLRLTVHPDRGLDAGRLEYAGIGLAYLAPNMAPGPWYYEGKTDDFAWLRVGLGGLFNTAGLVTIGVPQTVPTDQYGFTQRMSERYGTHGRVAVTPAAWFRHGEDWHGEECTLWVEGLVREEIAYGENLSLHRRYEIDLGARSFRLVDTVTNDGWFETPHQLLYHINLGFPLVDEGAEILASAGDPDDMSFTTGDGAGELPAAERWRKVMAPRAGFTHEGYVVPMRAAPGGHVSVALVNRSLRPETGGLGLALRYDQRQLPTYIAWRMMREGLYAIGLEPSTNPFGELEQLKSQGYPVMLAPGEQRRYELEFTVLDGAVEIDRFAANLPS
jgi:hypothetical protein